MGRGYKIDKIWLTGLGKNTLECHKTSMMFIIDDTRSVPTIVKLALILVVMLLSFGSFLGTCGGGAPVFPSAPFSILMVVCLSFRRLCSQYLW